MNNRLFKKIILLLFSVLPLFVHATHNRAAEITFHHDTLYTYTATIITYTKTSSIAADRPDLTIFWGDNTGDTLARLSKTQVGDPNDDISKNVYVGTHTYLGASVYLIYFEDPNRNEGVVNIPGSVNIPIYVQSKLIINPFLGFDNSPVLLEPPIDQGVINQVFIHNPNAYDPDGDSLSYELIPCKGAGGLPIAGYFYPPASNSFSMDAITGDLVWDSPQTQGEFNVAFLVKEWRNGQNIGFVERDMQITIGPPSANIAPVVANLMDTCVEAGTALSFLVTATDANNDILTLTATGYPFLLPVSPATFSSATGTGTVSSGFNWQTDCNHVRKSPYQVTFKVRENNLMVKLSDLETIRITVVGPSPKNPAATPLGNAINVSWNASVCTNAIGYKIYRRNGSYGFIPGHCETGVPAYTGYVQIATVQGVNSTSYSDDNNGAGLVPGNQYCYMIVAYYPDGAESYASLEVCAQLKRDLPVITNASVDQTDVSQGRIYVAWSKPDELDTVQVPGPYEYRLFHSNDFTGGNLTQIAVFSNLNDTTYEDTLINTVNAPWSYRIEFYNVTPGNTFLVGKSQVASSVFLSSSPTDNKVNLTWQENVPWTNTQYVVFRQDLSSGNFIPLDTVNQHSFADTGLVNQQQYCYKIETIGAYSGNGFVNPIINFSQEKCETPFDNVKPCAPDFNVANNCDLFQTQLIWNNPNHSCADDVVKYNIYYSPTEGGELTLLATINNANDTTFVQTNQESIAGCYLVTAVDSFGNESGGENAFCVDNCPLYELPNIFTPNGDDKNDLFHPLPYRFVKDVDMTIYNRWGLKVFSTTDPDINWNGKADNKGKTLSDGVYYYICKVNEIYLAGIRQRSLTGFVHLVDGK